MEKKVVKESLLSPYHQSIQKFTEQIMDAFDLPEHSNKEEQKSQQINANSTSIGVDIKS